MFDALSERLDAALARVKGRGKLDEKTVDATLKEIRLALLEADVNFKVVRAFVERLRERLVGEEVSKALNPGQQVVKAVNEELTIALGGEASVLDFGKGKPFVIMLAGLQGSGKTTAAGKLAALLKKRGRNPLLVACDLQRPAAVQQLRVNAEKVGVPIHAPVESGDPVPVAIESLQVARDTGRDVVIVDTAGRLHVDDELLDQARRIREGVGAHETLFVIDAMIGQEAVNVAKAFLDSVGFDGVILSKLDGDARGGAALSVREVTGKPIKFASIGEKLEDFEAFHPDRMASRILGMGDVLTLIEKAEESFTEEAQAAAEEALMSGTMTLDTFLDQLQMIKKMGPIQGILGMLPGVGKQLKDANIDDKQLAHVEAIIRSMTPHERSDPKKVLNGSRRKRIARGAGRPVHEVNQLVNQFEQMKKMMGSMGKMMGTQAGAKIAGRSSKGGGGKRPKGSGKVAQAKQLRELAKGGGLEGMDLEGLQKQMGGSNMGGFSGLSPAPKKKDR